MQRNGGRGLGELLNCAAIIHFIIDIGWLSEAGKAGKPGAARTGAPAGQRHAKVTHRGNNLSGFDVAARQLTLQRRVIFLQICIMLGVLLGDKAGRNEICHGWFLNRAHLPVSPLRRRKTIV